MRAVLWDLDGTLVDSEPAHALAFDAALEELGLAVPPDFHSRLLGASEDRVHAALVAETAAGLDRAAWRAVKWRHYRAQRIARLPRRRPAAAARRRRHRPRRGLELDPHRGRPQPRCGRLRRVLRRHRQPRRRAPGGSPIGPVPRRRRPPGRRPGRLPRRRGQPDRRRRRGRGRDDHGLPPAGPGARDPRRGHRRRPRRAWRRCSNGSACRCRNLCENFLAP